MGGKRIEETVMTKTAEVVALNARGFSLRDIAVQLRLSKKTVRIVLERAGVKRRTAQDAQRIGNTGRRALTVDAVWTLRIHAILGESWASLGRRFDVSEDSARLAGLGITWRHVPMPTLEACATYWCQNKRLGNWARKCSTVSSVGACEAASS